MLKRVTAKTPPPKRGDENHSHPGMATASGLRLSRLDWDFAKVEAGELAACCYYEYARESPSIVAHYDAGGTVESYPGGAFYRADLGGTFLTLPNPFYWPWLANASVKFVQTPWQALSVGFRKQVSSDYQPGRAVVDFEAFCSADSPRLASEIVSRGGARTGIDPETGIERITVEIDWASADNAQILASVKRWLETHRPGEANAKDWLPRMPEDFPERIGLPNSQGLDQGMVYRKSLDRLGILRLRRHLTFEEMQEVLEQEWSDEAGARRGNLDKYSNTSECNREFRKAIADFHSLFPFLPEEEVPYSLKPKRSSQRRISQPKAISIPEHSVMEQ